MVELLSFDGRVAIITGAGRGLGRAYALLLASRGARVVVNDVGSSTIDGVASTDLVEADPAEAVAKHIRESGGDAVSVRCDCRDGQQIVDKAVRVFGGVDIVICK
jgi:3-hydroxyacyl-CoA dehydrogenase/3a,7a,12a-trihydroxy-5b-cholest-24-enoyl-CoA hydratase